MVPPSDDFRGASKFHGHGPWARCKVAIMGTTETVGVPKDQDLYVEA